MKNYKSIYILLIIVLLTLFNVKQLSAQGPNSPEAASFEPVDATDMVNLVTGGFSYVLPLLNVPSPEGGYPIALSYHAGIAMDQEASWVGLGWSLNPGAINRSVNGYPDDWGKTNYSEFFYDKGWDENYYSFSAGVTLKGKYSVGLGLSWGSNQSLGGFVEAGIGWKNGVSVGGRIGTNGVGINGGYSGFSASFSTNGVGVGYSGTKRGAANLGVSLNYNYNSGLSGGVSISKSNGTFQNGIAEGTARTTSVGISFSSQGASFNAKVNGYGAGISTSTQTIDSGDYDITVSSSGFFIPIYIFYASFNHTKVKYSLFKYSNLYTSGMLYPVEANKLKTYSNSDNLSRLMKENHFMDVNIIQKFDNSQSYDDLLENNNIRLKNNLVLPNYDNYAINAQGLSGNMQPYTNAELILSGRGRGEQNQDNEYTQYLNYDISEYKAPPSTGISNGPGYEAIRKKHFTFTNVYNSFLRLETTNINQVPFLPSVHSDHIMEYFLSSNTTTYTNFQSLSNLDNRKREGNVIETFTNKEIRDNLAHGLIEAREQNYKLNRSDTSVFLDDGIGAFRVTTMDGKTYHYSLPVYNFETFYKNFQKVNGNGDDVDSEDDNFFEIQKTSPYATHWLLTAITGPDYFDKNGNGRVDEADYGYWVEFDYGKWSDGYIWRTPRGRVEEHLNPEDPTKKSYSYTWGRKQVYYLDAIKTRTHTALFVKELRKDDINESYTYNKEFASQENKVVLSPGDRVYGSFYGNNEHYWESTKAAMGDINLVNNSWWTIPEKTIGFPPNYWMKVFYVTGTKINSINLNFHKHEMLSLKKIILIRNSTNALDNISKAAGVSINLEKTGMLNKHVRIGSVNNAANKLTFEMVINRRGEKSPFWGIETNLYLEHPNKHLREFNINQHKKVLDIKDIEGLDLESKASQVIEFTHDYRLARNAPGTETGYGKLTLNELHFKGKGGVAIVPPYKFEYKSPSIPYPQNNVEDYIDAWGYYKGNPSVWSLNQITTPTGGRIKMEYESDEYYTEAASYEEVGLDNIESVISIRNNAVRVYFKNSLDANQYFSENSRYMIFYRVEDNTPRISISFGVRVVAVDSNWIEIEVGQESSLHNYDSNNCSNRNNCAYDLVVYGINKKNLAGGIRTKSIAVSNDMKNIATTEYIYKNGITSYAPSKEPRGIPYASELPAPLVMYEEVEMQNKDGDGNFLGKTIYEFETLKSQKEEPGYIFSLGECFRVKENQNTTFENGKVIANKFTIESRLGNIGRIKSIKTYNAANQLLNMTENIYKQNLNGNQEIGVTQESHKSYKRVIKDDEEKFYVSSTSKIDYPNVLEKTINTVGGNRITKSIDKYDFLTGQVLETTTHSSNGLKFKTKTIPAYYRYSNMGSMVDNANNKNMLAQVAANYTYLIDQNNTEKVVSAAITTWNSNWTYRDYKGSQTSPENESEKIWRKHKSYVWEGQLDTDGTYLDFNQATDDGFEWGVGATQTNAKWKQVSEITRYNHFSLPLESKDVNDNYAASKVGDTNSKIIATANAAYVDMYYSGAEYTIDADPTYFDSEIKSLGRELDATSHTGSYLVRISPGENAFEVNVPAINNPADGNDRTDGREKFKVSVWVKTPQKDQARIKVNGATVLFREGETVTAGSWTQLNGYITIPTTGATVAITSANGTIDLDDFRLHPVASSMTSYVYNQYDEVEYITGANGLSTKYVYNKAGELSEVYSEVIDQGTITGGFKLVKKYNKHYKNQ